MIYIVQAGDTLAKIALSLWGEADKWPTITAFNGKTDSRIEIGERLSIPLWIPMIKQPILRDPIPTNYYRFGYKIKGGQWDGKPHPGADEHQAVGAPVYAIGPGEVYAVEYGGGYGNYVMVKHLLENGVWAWSLYAHLRRVGVESGRTLEWPFFLGEEGNTETALYHVHLEIKKTPYNRLYPNLTPQTLHQWFYDPDTFSERMVHPVCW